MNAILKRTKLQVAGTLFAAFCVMPQVEAAGAESSPAAAGAAQPSVVKPMSREDVEFMLREARSAISQGKLEEAERLVTKAEAARIHYSMFHLGPTPASVRRELNRARRTGGAAPGAQEPSRSPKNLLSSAGDAASSTTVDPFAQRNSQALSAADETKRMTAATGERIGPAGGVQRLPSLNGAVSNPFAEPSSSGVAPARYEVQPAQATQPANPVARGSQDSAGNGSRTLPILSNNSVSGPATQDRYAADRSIPAAGVQSGSPLFADNETPTPPSGSAGPVAEQLPLPEVDASLPKPLEKAAPIGENAAAPPAAPPGPPSPSNLIDKADESQQLLARQLSAEVGKRQSEAKRLQEKDPERATAILREAQQLVKDSKLPESAQRELLARIDMTLKQSEQHIKQHGADIDLEKQNEKVLQAIDREREVNRKIKQEIADGIEEFNKLRDEHRYAEAEIVARRLYELDPEDPTTQQVLLSAKFIRREMMNRELGMAREEGNMMALTDTESATVINVGDDNPITYDKPRWEGYVKQRVGRDSARRRTERELEIEKKLKMPVQLRYENTPLSQVIDELSKLAGINIYLDPRGLSQEAVNSDTPVDLPLNNEISLESALNLILGPLHLSYVVKDDVLKITSEQLRDGEIYPVTYNVSDLVIPIPNFVPSSNIGLQGLINEAQAASNMQQRALGSGPAVLVNNRNQPSSSATDQVLAQFNPAPSGGMSPSTVPIGAGPGGMGAGANADFDSLIDLIVSTVETSTWAENGGGEAEIRPFPTNLSLVISQTQDVHRQIADLLEQLRRLQDLQVTIEVRFIRLNDSFFERIGIDFDLDVHDHGVNPDDPNSPFRPIGTQNSNTVGLVRSATDATFPTFATDLDIPFRQNSFDLTQLVPFGGPVGGGLNFGFAILSDIEAYFLIEAAQGDSRTNVLNAPKVTLFNGQQAFVADATQRPFVVGVIPVVGEFAAAQQPVIVVLNEGTMMTIQAVVSEDRRYVRMTIVPFFTQIGDVDEFTFEGSSSSTSSSSSSSTDDDDSGKSASEEESEEVSRSGVTVQLPSFSFVSVVTTVSVPDGGTVLLGGIKRLSEGRNEYGVPLLSKVPYINRLFRNISIGRETDSLMMMVTPRIIIQEEEEERLGIQVP